MKGWTIMVEKNFSRGKKALSLRLETFFQRSENRGRKDARAYGFVRGERVWKIFTRCMFI